MVNNLYIPSGTHHPTEEFTPMEEEEAKKKLVSLFDTVNLHHADGVANVISGSGDIKDPKHVDRIMMRYGVPQMKRQSVIDQWCIEFELELVDAVPGITITPVKEDLELVEALKEVREARKEIKGLAKDSITPKTRTEIPFECNDCNQKWNKAKYAKCRCPNCGSDDVHKITSAIRAREVGRQIPLDLEGALHKWLYENLCKTDVEIILSMRGKGIILVEVDVENVVNEVLEFKFKDLKKQIPYEPEKDTTDASEDFNLNIH